MNQVHLRLMKNMKTLNIERNDTNEQTTPLQLTKQTNHEIELTPTITTIPFELDDITPTITDTNITLDTMIAEIRNTINQPTVTILPQQSQIEEHDYCVIANETTTDTNIDVLPDSDEEDIDTTIKDEQPRDATNLLRNEKCLISNDGESFCDEREDTYYISIQDNSLYDIMNEFESALDVRFRLGPTLCITGDNNYEDIRYGLERIRQKMTTQHGEIIILLLMHGNASELYARQNCGLPTVFKKPLIYDIIASIFRGFDYVTILNGSCECDEATGLDLATRRRSAVIDSQTYLQGIQYMKSAIHCVTHSAPEQRERVLIIGLTSEDGIAVESVNDGVRLIPVMLAMRKYLLCKKSGEIARILRMSKPGFMRVNIGTVYRQYQPAELITLIDREQGCDSACVMRTVREFGPVVRGSRLLHFTKYISVYHNTQNSFS